MGLFGRKKPPLPPEPPAGEATPEENPGETGATQPIGKPALTGKKPTIKIIAGKTAATRIAADEAIAEFIPASIKPQSDVYTMMLVLAFIFFCAGVYLAGKELHEFYDVKFGFLSPYQKNMEFLPPEKQVAAPKQSPQEAKPVESQPPAQGQPQPPTEQPPKK